MITMKKQYFMVFILALVCLSAWLAGCTEEKFFDIVIGDEICPDSTFDQNSASEVFTDTVYVAAGAEVDSALARSGYSRSDIKSAILNGITYVVTEYSGATNWIIGGEIHIQRMDVAGPEVVLLAYDEASVPGTLNNPRVAVPTPEGADVVNQMLEDFLAGANPEFRLVVVNGDCSPNPSDVNRIVFKWTACLQVQLIGATSSDVFDPL
jgi:hypothetical protein